MESNRGGLGGAAPEWYSSIAKHAIRDLAWVANGPETYVAMLASLPEVFAWRDADPSAISVAVLGYSTAARRFESALDFIGRYDEPLSLSMREGFRALPSGSRSRFLIAPETVYRVSRLRKEPAKCISLLCQFLNAEEGCNGAAMSGRSYWTSLGDSYFIDSTITPAEDPMTWSSDRPFVAARLGSRIPVDFFSPNVASAKQTTLPGEYLEFTENETGIVWHRLVDAFNRIEKVSSNAARLIKEFVRVIIPLKVRSGAGSTSERSFPGRVLLQGVETCTLANLASALVHEAIHQFLYLLEYEGTFVLREPEGGVRSPWSGRSLPLHSFFHACFVWYGLANFWHQASTCGKGTFDEQQTQRELERCLLGFRGQNPISALGSNAAMVRSDALQIACTLQDRLRSVLELWPERRVARAVGEPESVRAIVH